MSSSSSVFKWTEEGSSLYRSNRRVIESRSIEYCRGAPARYSSFEIEVLGTITFLCIMWIDSKSVECNCDKSSRDKELVAYFLRELSSDTSNPFFQEIDGMMQIEFAAASAQSSAFKRKSFLLACLGAD